jgi:hypothetical protein
MKKKEEIASLVFRAMFLVQDHAFIQSFSAAHTPQMDPAPPVLKDTY